MTHTVTSYRFKNLWISALILLALGSLAHPAHSQIVTTNNLTTSDGAENDHLGFSVSVSGSYLAASAAFKTINGNFGQGAVYIYIRSGTSWTQQAEIIAADGVADDNFGTSVCLSGNTLVVGTPYKTVNGNASQGVVYIYTRSGTTWTLQTEFTASDGATYSSFGYSVSLNGSSLAIGAPSSGVTGNAGQVGAAYIYVHAGSTWTQKAEITPADGASGDSFGWSVSLGSTTIAIGSPQHTVNGAAQQGATYVYLHSGTKWNQQAELAAADGINYDEFGWSVDLSGAILVVGSPFHTPSGGQPDQGAAYVYIRTGTTWNQQAEVTGPDGEDDDFFGWSVAFSGTTLAAGAPYHSFGDNTNVGVVYTFLHSGSNWTLQQELTETVEEVYDSFGYSVCFNGSNLAIGAPTRTNQQGEVTVLGTGSAALTGTVGATNDLLGYSVSLYGSTLAAGAPGKKISGKASQGAVFVYSQAGTTWTQQAEITAPDGASNDDFGYSVSVNGNTLVVGAPYHTVNGIESGAVYVYTLSGTTWTLQAEITAKDAAGTDNFGHAVSLNASTLAVGAPYKTMGANTEEGAVYIFNRSGSNWVQRAELTPLDGASYDEFGYSVSLTSTNLAVGSPNHTVGSNSSQGVAYVFTRSGSTWSQNGEVTAGDGGSVDYFGWSVGLESSTSSSILVVSAPTHVVDTTFYQQGAVYSYYSPTVNPFWSETSELMASDTDSGDYFGYSLSFNGPNLIIGAAGKTIDGNIQQGAAYIYTLTGAEYETGWLNASELTAKDGKSDDLFGFAVSVNGGQFAIGTPAHKVKSNSDQGAVYTLP